MTEIDMGKSPLGGKRIAFGKRLLESPFAPGTEGAMRLGAYSGDYQGAFSLEKFATSSGLTYTHEDAGGWLAYLEKFNPSNFWYRDENVRIWAYYEDYDNWQDTYGMDAVKSVYHSGHGGMEADGRFHVPLGQDWGGLGTTAWSDKMRLGNEQVRYIFWSTCLSCRVLEGHNPMRTWNPANLGFRMLFGYETTSVDNPNYGKFFWEEWNKGKSLSTAFLDASWRISHNQAPAVVACGSTQQEANDRLNNERLLYWEAVGRTWWSWRWYYAAKSANAIRSLNRKLPGEMLIADLLPCAIDEGYVASVLERHGLEIGMPAEIAASPDGSFRLLDGERNVAFQGDGSYEIQLASPNRENRDLLTMSKAISVAKDFLHQEGVEGLAFDRVMLSQEASAAADGSLAEGPFVTETVVQFAQEINGLPVLLPGGSFSMNIDNDGAVTGFKNATRSISRMRELPRNSPAAPGEEMPMKGDPEALLEGAWDGMMKRWLAKGSIPRSFSVVPGTYEIGYAIKGDKAVLVARNEVEADCGGGYRKRFALEVPLFE